MMLMLRIIQNTVVIENLGLWCDCGLFLVDVHLILGVVNLLQGKLQ